MRPTRFVVVAFAGVFVLAACTGQASPGSGSEARPRALPSEVLLLDTDEGQLALSTPTGSVLFRAPGAIASADGSLVFRASTRNGGTSLDTIDAATGEVAASARLDGILELWVASGSGRTLALMEPLPRGWDRAIPVPRSHTVIVVADPTGTAEPRRFELDGNYEPEAFSTDDSNLFLIQHLPAESPTVYRVTMLDLDRGKVFPVFGPFKSPPERMPGTRLQQELAPDGGRLYTLYSSSRAGYAPHGAQVDQGAAVSFVHVLDLEEGWAHCAGLPKAFWDRPASAQAMAVSSDGRRLYVVDSELGLLTVMDTETFANEGTARIPIGASDPLGTSARLSADGSTLFVTSAGADGTLFAIDTATLEVTDRWHVGGAASGLGLSVDGRRLYVAQGDRVSVLDPSNGQELGAVPFSSPAPVVRVSVIGA